MFILVIFSLPSFNIFFNVNRIWHKTTAQHQSIGRQLSWILSCQSVPVLLIAQFFYWRPERYHLVWRRFGTQVIDVVHFLFPFVLRLVKFCLRLRKTLKSILFHEMYFGSSSQTPDPPREKRLLREIDVLFLQPWFGVVDPKTAAVKYEDPSTFVF